jgi:ribonuclease J
MREVVFDAIDGTLRSIPQKRRGVLAMVQEAVQKGVRSAIKEAWGKKPVVKVLLSVVEARG